MIYDVAFHFARAHVMKEKMFFVVHVWEFTFHLARVARNERRINTHHDSTEIVNNQVRCGDYCQKKIDARG